MIQSLPRNAHPITRLEGPYSTCLAFSCHSLSGTTHRDFWRETGGFVAGNQKLLSEIVWPHFFAIQLILFSHCMYCTMPRTGAREREAKGAADILWPDAARKFERRAYAETKHEGWTVTAEAIGITIFPLEKN